MKAILIYLFVLLSLCGKAQEYKTGILYQVTGPVKFLSTHRGKVSLGMIGSLLDSASFSENGKNENWFTVFDDDGYPLGIYIDDNAGNDSVQQRSCAGSSGLANLSIEGKGLLISYKVDYDDSHKITSSKLEYSIDVGSGDDFRIKTSMTADTSFEYVTNRFGVPEVSKSKSVCKIKDSILEIECIYSNYVYDERGNWISRDVLENVAGADATEYTESREIEYFS